jgi:solute carrier family 25 oxoglutarate transporter 11
MLAQLARQLLWSSTRFGLYAWLMRDWMGHRPDGNGAAMHVKMLCGVVAGAVGATVGTPADVILIRMQADRHWEPQYRRQYHSVFDGWATTVRGDGLTSLWRGCLPTVARATLITSCQLPAYFTFKELLCADQHADVRHALHLDDASPDSTAVHLACSVAAGLVAALVTTPVDVIKTRIMNAQVCRPETPQYNGVTGSFRLILSTEGPQGFLKGFAPTALRLVPHNMILWVVQEKVHTWLDSGVFA